MQENIECEKEVYHAMKKYFHRQAYGRSIAQNIASLSYVYILACDVMNLLYYEHWADLQKKFSCEKLWYFQSGLYVAIYS